MVEKIGDWTEVVFSKSDRVVVNPSPTYSDPIIIFEIILDYIESCVIEASLDLRPKAVDIFRGVSRGAKIVFVDPASVCTSIVAIQGHDSEKFERAGRKVDYSTWVVARLSEPEKPDLTTLFLERFV